MTTTRSGNAKAKYIVLRAIRHNLIPEYKKGKPLSEQTFNTGWALHVLAVMSKNGKPNIKDVKKVIDDSLHAIAMDRKDHALQN